jgi:hypothetical protein
MGSGERSERWAGDRTGAGERSERRAGDRTGAARVAGVWAALRTEPLTEPLTDALGTNGVALAAGLDGVIAVGADAPSWATAAVPMGAGDTDAQCLAAAIRGLPAAALGLAWCDARRLTAGSVGQIAELWQRIDGSDAAVEAAPVTDAIKEVRDGRIRRGVDRDGLCVPAPPVVLRNSAALGRLLAALDAGHDPVAALAAARLEVLVVRHRRPVAPVGRSPGGR